MLLPDGKRNLYNECIHRLHECAANRLLADGERCHQLIRESGWIHDRLLGNLLVRMYGLCGCLGAATAAFAAIHGRNAYSWNLLVAANAQNGHLQQASVLFHRMPQRDLFAWSAMIANFFQGSHLDEAKIVFDRMPERDPLSWNSILAAYSHNGQLRYAVEIFHRMPARDLSAWNSILQIHAQLDQIDAMKSSFDSMPDRDVVSWTTVVAALARKGRIDDAAEIFYRMPQTNTRGWNSMLAGSHCEISIARSIFSAMPERDLVSWNELLAASARSVDPDAAAAIFHGMPQRDVISWTTTIHALMSGGRIDEGRKLFDEIPSRNVVTWTVAITSYGDGGDVDSARESFLRMPQYNLFACNAMMGALSDQGSVIHLRSCRDVFDSLPCRDAISWNTIISGYAQFGHTRDAIDLFTKMPDRDNVSWNAILLAYTEASNLRGVVSVFDRMPSKDLIAWNTVIRAYAMEGHIDEARQAFDGADERDVLSWTAMIRGYTHNACYVEAIRLFQTMDLEGIKPGNGGSFVAALNACSSPRFLDQGKMIRERMTSIGVEVNDVEAAAVISMLGKCGDLPEAERFYCSLATETRFAAAGAMVSVLASNARIGDARELFDRLPETAKDWNSMLQAHIQAGQIDTAEELFQIVPPSSRDIVSWSAMITAYARSGRGDEALAKFRLMDLDGTHPDSRAFVAAIEAAAIASDPLQLLTIHELAVECGLDSHTIVGTSIVDALSKRCMVESAWRAFSKISSRARVPWSALIAGLARSGCSREAVDVFQDMLHHGATPDAVTFVSVLAACSHSGLLRRGVDLFVAMLRDFGVVPGRDHYRCVLDLLGRAGLLGEAEELMEEAAEVIGREDSVAWTSLLGSCRNHGDLDRGRRLGEAAVGFKWEEQPSSPFVLLSHMS